MLRLLLTLSFVWSVFTLHAQPALSPEEWREDIRFLQRTVHDDYPFLFKKVTAEAFDAAVEELYAAVPDLEDHEVSVGIARLIALFGYGHTRLGLDAWNSGNTLGFQQMPYNLYAFSDGIYVQGAHRDYARAVGARVTHVAGTPVEAAIAAIRPVVPVENEQFLQAYGLGYLGNPAVLHAQGVTEERQETVTLTLVKDGRSFDVTFAPASYDGYPLEYGMLPDDGNWMNARDQSTTPLWLRHLDKVYFYEYLPNSKTVYVRQSQVEHDPTQMLPDFYEEVFAFVEDNDVERLVLDVRLNGGGNNYNNLPVVTGIIRTDKINRVGKLFVIIGRRTFSAAQNLVNELDNYTNAIFVGEPTSENVNFYGDNRAVELPKSQLQPRLSFAWWQDKPQWENADWLAPHLPADLSFADYRDNVDPAMKAILRYNGELTYLNPMARLTELFNLGKMDEVATEARQFVEDPNYRYYPFERTFARTGSNLLSQGQIEAAMFVLEMNAELFPDSAGAWDSLAEAHRKAGNEDKAVELYRRVIALDPDGATGKHAREMLAEMDAEE
ncbi:tetratricopeptide repeat protein [Neolewinella xylanilytica]|uniref:Tetratricopeptide repeat protein n=1 Tax=Neolewinella xylanilytica TaxID=1514080 RepID=A0A2S6I7B3_9BACT|nr:tetratricopeptide repeat protein [Neolewinella xylanilytica]PPK87385.1 tetratricopeptide repeat protein [Neolewinella xylanilytica]